jgi:CRP/FNR family transcriptional regulator, cyclic AMP receptor protein
MALAGQELYDTFAEALEPCLLYVLSKADMVRLLQKEPRVAVRLLEIVGDRLRRAEMQLMNVTFKTIRARLASVLMDLSEHYGPDITGYTHQDLAERVGTYREGASLILAVRPSARRRVIFLRSQLSKSERKPSITMPSSESSVSLKT